MYCVFMFTIHVHVFVQLLVVMFSCFFLYSKKETTETTEDEWCEESRKDNREWDRSSEGAAVGSES